MRGQLYNELSKLDVKTIFDIGACDFHDSIELLNRYPQARVLAIEADPENYFRHHKRAETVGIETFNYAMSDKNGYVTFYPSLMETERNIEWKYAGSIVKPLVKPNTNEGVNHTVTFDLEGIQIPSIRFDYFCDTHKIQKVDFVFMDVEGAEYKIIESLGKYRPRLIFCETAHYDTKSFDNELNLEEFDSLMESYGYFIVERLQYDTLYKYDGNFN